MKKESGTIIYSPSDLIRYLASPFGSWLDRYRLEGLGEIKPDEQTEEEKLLSRTGDEHEQSILNGYKISHAGLVEITKDDNEFDVTRAATQDMLVAQSRPRLAALAAEGVTTIEIKSGYGQDTATELKQLKVARHLAGECAVDVRSTLLAAHALPPEFADRSDAYIDYVCREMIPAIAAAHAADAVDAFCESIAFTPAQTRRVFACAREHRLPVKLHADQLSDQHGAALAAEFGALSADHLEHTNERGVQAMASAGTIAVLLPGAFYSLRETRLPPIEAFRAHGVPIAIASDCNPGTSPAGSLVLMLSMACTLFRLTPEEALAGVTRHAARALGLVDRGALSIGQHADIALWDIDKPAELAYRLGGNACAGVVRGGTLQRMSF